MAKAAQRAGYLPPEIHGLVFFQCPLREKHIAAFFPAGHSTEPFRRQGLVSQLPKWYTCLMVVPWVDMNPQLTPEEVDIYAYPEACHR